MEHTKGDWKMLDKCKATYFVELGNNEGIIAIFTDSPERTEEIAHPIAAAPDLLVGCRIGLSYINAAITKVPRPIQDLESDKKEIEEAIAKAEKS